jgi:hypothetical protein
MLRSRILTGAVRPSAVVLLVRPSVRRPPRPSVRPSVVLLVRPSVRRPAVRPSVVLPIRPSVRRPPRPSVRPSVCRLSSRPSSS